MSGFVLSGKHKASYKYNDRNGIDKAEINPGMSHRGRHVSQAVGEVVQ